MWVCLNELLVSSGEYWGGLTPEMVSVELYCSWLLLSIDKVSQSNWLERGELGELPEPSLTEPNAQSLYARVIGEGNSEDASAPVNPHLKSWCESMLEGWASVIQETSAWKNENTVISQLSDRRPSKIMFISTNNKSASARKKIIAKKKKIYDLLQPNVLLSHGI